MAVSRYDLRWRRYGDDDWTLIENLPVQTSYRMEGLRPLTFYEIQVRATDEEGTGRWSATGLASTDPGIAYNFRHRPTGTTDWTTVAEFLPDTAYRAEGLTQATEYEAQARTVTPADESEWTASGTASTESQAIAPVFADDTGDEISGTVGQAIADVTVPEATGMPAPTYAAVGDLPAGVSFDPDTREISFDEDAIEVGSGTITVRATNSEGDDDWTVDYAFTAPLTAPSFSDDTGDEISGTIGTAIADVIVPAAVRVPGNEQELSLLAENYVGNLSSIRYWDFPANSRPAIDAALTGGPARTARRAGVHSDGTVDLTFSVGQTDASLGNDLSSIFEQYGSIVFTADGTTLQVNLAGADTTEPYNWVPSNSSDVIAFFNTLPDTSGSQAGTLALRDYDADAAPNPAPTYAVVGDLPAGVTFDADTRALSFDEDVIVVGSGTIRIRAMNSEDSDDWTVAYSFAAALAAPVFADDTGDAIAGTVGTAIAAVAVPAATGNPAPTYAVVGNLPAGLNFNTGTRVLSGTPTAAGSGTITIRATNSEGDDDWTVAYSFAAALAAPVFADDTGDAISGTVGTAIAAVTVPAATGNPAPTYAVVGNLPAGLNFNTGTRVLSGTPTAAGSGTITIRATNSEGDDDWTVAYSFAAALAAPVFADDTGDAISGTVGTAIAAVTVPAATGNPAPTYAVVGNLPAGLNFNTGTRVLSGTPTAAGSGTITIRATNSEGDDDWTVAYSFAAAGPALVLADLDDAGLLVDCKVLIEAGAPPAVWGIAPRTVSGMLIDGEFGLGSTDETATLLRFRNALFGSDGGGTHITINDNGSFNLSAYFVSPEAGAENTLTIMNAARQMVAFSAGDTRAAGAGNYVTFAVPDGPDPDEPEELRDFVDAIAAGERFIFALRRPAIVTDRDAAADLSSGVPAISAAAEAEAEAVTDRDATAELSSGAPSVSAAAQAQSITNRDAAASLSSGAPSIDATGDASEPDAANSETYEIGAPESYSTTRIRLAFNVPLTGLQIPASLRPAGATGDAFGKVVTFDSTAGSSYFWTADNDGASEYGGSAGPEMSTAFENAGAAFTLISANGQVSLGGPETWGLTNAAEPYTGQLSGDDKTALAAWLATYTGTDITFVLSDGDTPPTLPVENRDAAAALASGSPTISAAGEAQDLNRDAAADLSSGAPAVSASAEAQAFTNRDAAASLATGAPTVSAAGDAQALLTLDAFPTAGRETDALALIEAGAPPGVFGRSPRAVGGTLLDGELDLSGSGESINWLRFRDATSGIAGSERISLNDDGPLNLQTYFAAGGDGNDLTVTVQTASSTASFPVAGNIDGSGGNYVIFNIPAGDQSVIASIGAGERFIFALWRDIPATNRDAAADLSSGAPAVSAAADAETFTNRDAAASLATGAPAVSAAAVAEVVTNQDAAADLSSGAPAISATADAQVPANRDAAAALATGAPAISAAGDAQALTNRDAAADLATGAPAVSVAGLAESPFNTADYAQAQARSLAGTAPRYALEITHPDIDEPVRVVGDNAEHMIEGNRYLALAFRAQPPQFKEGEIPRATLEIDNVGRELTQWVETTGGGRGAKMRVMMVHKDPTAAQSHIAWELPALAVGVTELTNEVVSVQLVYRSGKSRPGIKMRHTPTVSPGLF